MRTFRSPNSGQTSLTLQHRTSPASGYKPALGHNRDGYPTGGIPIRTGFKKGGCIQDVNKSIKKRGTKGKCTPITKKGVKPGQSGSKIKKEATSKASAIHDKYEKASSDVKKYNKRLKQKVFGGASAAIAGTVGGHVGAKKKFPKYKKFMESDIKTVDGKLTIVPKKKK